MDNNITIESLLLNKNREAFDRIIKMIESLIVKDDVEADNLETKESINSYYKYEGAFEESDSFLDYDITKELLMSYGLSEINSEKYSEDKLELVALCNLGDEFIKNILKDLRSKRVKSYKEMNVYYRPFVGLPISEEEYIKIENKDIVGTKMYLHDVSDETPKTKHWLYFEREIDNIKKKYDYLYLKFIENPFTVYGIRHKLNFDIIYYDKDCLEPEELIIFFEAYNIAKNEVLSHDYVEAFSKTYNAYNAMMFSFILFYTFNLYCAKNLDRYSVRNYTREEIYDILDSNGLSNLKSFNMNILRNIVNNLVNLKQYAGTPKVLDYIFEIINDKTLNIKRLFLTKKYNLDSTNKNIYIDENQLYDKNVDLIFEERLTKVSEDNTDVKTEVYPYDVVTKGDELWAGVKNLKSETAKEEKRKLVKKQILEKSFSSVSTKYLVLNKVLNVYKIILDVSNKMGLFYQIMEERGLPIKKDRIYFKNQETTPLSVFAMWCYVYGMLNDLTEPEFILKDASSIEGVMKLRNNSSLIKDTKDLYDTEIDLGDGFNRKIGDYISKDDIGDYLIRFNYNEDTPIDEIFDQYDNNVKIIEMIDKKLEETNDLGEFMVWTLIKKSNYISKLIDNLFDGYTTYTSFIINTDPNFYSFIKNRLDAINILNGPAKKREQFKLVNELKNEFSKYLKNSTKGHLFIADTIESGSDEEVDNLQELSKLFDEFMSIYTVLYKTSYTLENDDQSSNYINLLYHTYARMIEVKHDDFLQLDYVKYEDHFDKSVENELSLFYKYFIHIFISREFEIELDYIIDDTTIFTETYDSVEIEYEKISDHIVSEASLGLDGFAYET